MHKMPNAIILCGGAGSRLRSVTGDAPKAMALIAGRPFLELLLLQLARSSIRRVILAVGHRKEAIMSHFGDHHSGLKLVYSIESSPLGTGGALRNAADLLESDVALVMNGDSYIDADLNQFGEDHHDNQADVTVMLTRDESRNDCGSVRFDENGCISNFQEKISSREPSYVNAGVYLIRRSLLLGIPSGNPISIERELFPQWLRDKKLVRAALSSSACVDIGTPERYLLAQTALAHAEDSKSYPD